jgi:hypothetical protein
MRTGITSNRLTCSHKQDVVSHERQSVRRRTLVAIGHKVLWRRCSANAQPFELVTRCCLPKIRHPHLMRPITLVMSRITSWLQNLAGGGIVKGEWPRSGRRVSIDCITVTGGLFYSTSLLFCSRLCTVHCQNSGSQTSTLLVWLQLMSTHISGSWPKY